MAMITAARTLLTVLLYLLVAFCAAGIAFLAWCLLLVYGPPRRRDHT